MKKILSAIAVAASATLPAFAAVDPACVLYYDFETMAEDGYTVENIANSGVMQLSGGNRGFATVVEATPSASSRLRILPEAATVGPPSSSSDPTGTCSPTLSPPEWEDTPDGPCAVWRNVTGDIFIGW